MLIVGAGGGYYYFQQSKAQAQQRAVEAQVKRVGYPEGFPLDTVPAYPGLKVNAAKRDDAKSTKGEPMDHWLVKGTTPDAPEKVFDLYKKTLMDKGMSQTTYMQGFNGIAANYADQRFEVDLTADGARKPTKVTLEVFRLRK